jgi:hypothetical protein
VLYLNALSDNEIRSVIKRKLGIESGSIAAERILSTSNLKELARKPVLIELLLAALDEVDPGLIQNQTLVYLYSTNRLLLRNISEEKTFTSMRDKVMFLGELAWQLIKTNTTQIHYTDFPEHVRSIFGDRIQDDHDLDYWSHDLRTQTLLHRNAAGYFEFAHKSLAEYFVALRFGIELGAIEDLYPMTYGVSALQGGIDWQACTVGKLASSFGLYPLRSSSITAVTDFLVEMMSSKSHDNLSLCSMNAVLIRLWRQDGFLEI